MFIIHQDYDIINAKTPVLTRQENGQFEFKYGYFLEFAVKANNETLEKIKTICAPFDFSTGVQQAIFSCLDSKQRLFLLAWPDIIRNNFKDSDDFLAFALCLEGQKSTTIQYFEVNWNFRHSYEPLQKYRRVGTSAIKALQRVYQNRELCGQSASNALNFWLKNSFTCTDENEQHIRWYQNMHTNTI